MGGVAVDATARPGEHPTVEPAPGPAVDSQETPRPTLGYRPAYGLVQYLQELGETMVEPAAGNVEEPTLWS